MRVFSGIPLPRAVIGSVALAVALLAAAAGCGGEDDISYARGRQLHFSAKPPRVAEKVIFTDGSGRRQAVRPRASNRQLAVVSITVANLSTTVASMLLDEGAVQLGDRRSDRIEAINPYEQAVPADDTDDRGAIVLEEQLLWGQVELEKDLQIEGSFIFDVPKGLILGTLWWNQTDTVSMDFVDYQRGR